MKTEIIAKVCHEVNKAFCDANGDNSQKSWDAAEEWQRQSTIQGVEFALKQQPTPAQQHEAWMKEKTQAGWVWGPEKDAQAKTHPYMVPYQDLPQVEKTKDYLFVAVVNALKNE